MKSNFKLTKKSKVDKVKSVAKKNKEKQGGLTRSEWEKHVSKEGAAGSFMIFRSKKKQDELGLDEL